MYRNTRTRPLGRPNHTWNPKASKWFKETNWCDEESLHQWGTKTNQQAEFCDEFKVFLNKNIGTISKQLLGFVICKSVSMMDSDKEPPFGQPDSPFSSYFEEIQEQASICIVQNGITGYNTKFQNDNHMA